MVMISVHVHPALRLLSFFPSTHACVVRLFCLIIALLANGHGILRDIMTDCYSPLLID